MTAPPSNPSKFVAMTKLDALQHTGIRIDSRGRLSDWRNWPPPVCRPKSTPNVLSVRQTFSDEEIALLQVWTAAAELEEFRTPVIFQQLEVLCPSHTWMAWMTKSRTPEFTMLTKPELHLTSPFPGLARGSAKDAEVQPYVATTDAVLVEQHDASVAITDGAFYPILPHPNRSTATYQQLKPSIPANVVAILGLSDVEEIKDFIAQPWVLEAYRELVESELDPEEDCSGLTVYGGGKRRSQGRTIMDAAVKALKTQHGRFYDASTDKSHWIRDDHAARFVTSVVRGGRSEGQRWSAFQDERYLPILCEKAHFLLGHLEWLHRPTHGNSKASLSARKYKTETLGFLKSLRLNYISNNTSMLAPPTAVGAQPGTIDTPIVNEESHPMPILSEENHHSLVDGGNASRPFSLPPWRRADHRQVSTAPTVPVVEATPTDNTRSLFLLSANARAVWKQRQARLLNSWGVTAEQKGVCILVPYAWRNVEPAEIVQTYGQAQFPEMNDNRLSTSLHGDSKPWNRYTAWFQQEREYRDLVVFQAGDDNQRAFEGSHLCHQSFCVVDGHTIYEPRTTNLSRAMCVTFARRLREYGMPIPAFCKRSDHDPPCMLQHAALTSTELIYQQFCRLRRQLGLPTTSPPERPSNHPPMFETFEPDLPLTLPTQGRSIVAFEPITDAVSPTPLAVNKEHNFHCSFCVKPMRLRNLYRFWTHIKMKHQDVSIDERLRAIKEQTAAYLAYIRTKGYERAYEARDRVQWARMQQTQLASFDWPTFRNWRLPEDNLTGLRQPVP